MAIASRVVRPILKLATLAKLLQTDQASDDRCRARFGLGSTWNTTFEESNVAA